MVLTTALSTVTTRPTSAFVLHVGRAAEGEDHDDGADDDEFRLGFSGAEGAGAAAFIGAGGLVRVRGGKSAEMKQAARAHSQNMAGPTTAPPRTQLLTRNGRKETTARGGERRSDDDRTIAPRAGSVAVAAAGWQLGMEVRDMPPQHPVSRKVTRNLDERRPPGMGGTQKAPANRSPGPNVAGQPRRASAG